MSRKIKFIINPKSGFNKNPRRILHWIDSVIKPSGIAYDISYTEKPGDGTSLAKEAANQGFDIVAVVGGDGTINEAGRALFHSDVALAVIPAGSGNGFARNFKIPLKQYQAIQLLLEPRIIPIDIGKINNHYFFNVAGFGLDAHISEDFERFAVRGPLSYFWVGVRAFFNFRSEKAIIKFDQQTIETTPLVVSIVNAPEYGNGAIIAPAAKPDDGLLDLIILDRMSFWKAVANLIRLFNGTINQVPAFHSYPVTSLEIIRSSPGPIETDGDPHHEGTHLKIKIIPKSLQVLVGPNFRSGK
jgi:YegS/Rv2252/BmrU family lipid kinase